MRCTKKGQAAVGAVVFIAILTAIVVFFIILLPAEERAELLGDPTPHANSSSSSSDSSSDSDSEDILEAQVIEELLSVSPGRIDYFSQQQVEHPLPVANIYTRTESKILAQRNVVNTKSGVFTDEQTTLTFTTNDLDNANGFVLAFTATEVDGALRVELNGDPVFSDELMSGNQQTVLLPQNSLQTQNTLTFSSESVGAAFWHTNEAVLNDVKVVADVTDTSAQESKSIFLVSETEKDNLKEIELKFQPDCNYATVGMLRIEVNRNIIYEGIPDCEVAMVPLAFSPDKVFQGENEVVFRTEKGRYLLSHVLVESKLNEVEFPTYFFDISNEEYEEIVQDEIDRMRVTLDFVDVVVRKRGDLVFNGHTIPFDTKEVSFVVDVSEDVVRGTNSLKIKPRKTLEIREVRAEIVD